MESQPPIESTEALLRRAQRGEPAALDALLARYLPSLRAYVRVHAGELFHRRESDSDVVQSACVELVDELARLEYRGEPALRAWLFERVHNKLRQHVRYHRAQKRDARREYHPELSDDEEAALLECYTSFCSPSRELARREQVAAIEAAIARLPEHYREVVTLAKIVGLSQKELAARMGRTVPSVRNLLNRALVRLAAILDAPG